MPRSSSSSSACCCWWCRSLIAFILKFLNFLQAFVGVSIIIYSIWMLNHYNKHGWDPPSPSAPSPENTPPTNSHFPASASDFSDVVALSSLSLSRKFGFEFVFGFGNSMSFDFNRLPAPWFIYSFMGVGVLLSLVTCIGYIAAETINGCCLCFYTMLTSTIIIIEAALVAFITFNDHWDEDLPYDPTGELDSLREFIKDNIDICKWVGLTVMIVQALSLLLSMVLRAVGSSRTEGYDSDDDYAVGQGGVYQPLFKSQGGQTSSSNSMDGKGIQHSTWNNRMKEKYGLNMSAFTHNY